MPKRQKPKYSKEVMERRMKFARKVVSMSRARLDSHIALEMDGVIISKAPENATDRSNFVRHGEDHEWRKKGEAYSPELAGKDEYPKQVPLARAIPLWGGCSSKGFAVVAFHARKKFTTEEWVKVVNSGKLRRAIKQLRPPGDNGPFNVICDNEGFLEAPASEKAHAKAKVRLWAIPPRSPDLNPVERFWSYLRRRLRAMELKDFLAEKPVLTKAQYKVRIRNLVKTKKAQTVAASCAGGLRKVCQIVIRKKCAASGK